MHLAAFHATLRRMIDQSLPSPPPACADDFATFGFTELDARGPTPPNHQKAILAALATLPVGHPQCVRTKVRPISLLESLATRNIISESSELPDGSWRTILRRVTPCNMSPVSLLRGQ
jgi:hypothetical protein